MVRNVELEKRYNTESCKYPRTIPAKFATSSLEASEKKKKRFVLVASDLKKTVSLGLQGYYHCLDWVTENPEKVGNERFCSISRRKYQ